MAAGSQRRYRPTLTENEKRTLLELIEADMDCYMDDEQENTNFLLLKSLQEKLYRVNPTTPRKPRQRTIA